METKMEKNRENEKRENKMYNEIQLENGRKKRKRKKHDKEREINDRNKTGKEIWKGTNEGIKGNEGNGDMKKSEEKQKEKKGKNKGEEIKQEREREGKIRKEEKGK